MQFSDIAELILRLGAVMIVYAFLDRLILLVAKLREASYQRPVILVEIGKRYLALGRRLGIAGSIAALLAILVLVGVLVVWADPLFHSWSQLAYGTGIRIVVGLLVFLLTWVFSTYRYNHYYNQKHLADRAMLVLLACAVLWKPIFLLPYVLLVVAVIWQFNYPVAGYSVAEHFQLTRILLLFFSAFVLASLGVPIQPSDFVLVMLALLASAYWVPGLGKLRLRWIGHGQIYRLLPATYANGWLGFLSKDRVSALARLFARVDVPLRLFTLVAEVGALAALWSRTTLQAWLVIWILFHLGIFLFAGIFFWKWILFDALLLVLLNWDPLFLALDIFTPVHFGAALLLILSARIWFAPVNLSWYNARINYTYRFEAVFEDDRRYPLSPGFFAPYEYQFTLGGYRFWGLVKNAVMPIGWGATQKRVIADVLASAGNVAELEALEAKHGKPHTSAEQTAALEKFLKRFIGNLNQYGFGLTWFQRLAPAHQVVTFSKVKRSEYQGSIKQIDVFQVTSQFDDQNYAEIRNVWIHTVEIPSVR
jgi:hypothetical protein